MFTIEALWEILFCQCGTCFACMVFGWMMVAIITQFIRWVHCVVAFSTITFHTLVASEEMLVPSWFFASGT